MKNQEWLDKIVLSSIRLRQLNELRIPINFASGCLINYFGKKIVLTVSHATGNNKNWGIEIKSKVNIATQFYNIGAMMFLAVGTINSNKVKKVDFSYAVVPDDLQPFYYKLNEEEKKIYEIPNKILTINFEIEPSADKEYGFFGQSKLVTGLKFIGIEDAYYKFKLPTKHPGHDYFKGTSGAPILDTDGNLISLVCRGGKEENIIYGLALKKYKLALDIEVGNINK